MKQAALLLCLLALPLCACGGQERTKAEYRLITASDLHYIAPSLTDQGPLFTALADSGDGKVMLYIEELTDAFLAEVLVARPDALLLTGDLSFNGEIESHEALAEKLRAVEDAGIPVLVQTGNHDLDNPGAASFSGESYTRVPSADSEDFRRIYAQFGFDEAISRDADSLSYVYALNETTRILMLDFNTRHDPCGISENSLRWVKEVLRNAEREGVNVLAAGHQNLFRQTLFVEGYVVKGADKLAGLFRRYKVPLYLSGHLHCQHWKTERGVTEIATSALSVSPCQYGVVTAAAGRLRYETRETDVSAWAAKAGRQEEELLHFREYAAAYFDARGLRQVPESLADFPYSEAEKVLMTDYMLALSRAYFTGDLRDLERLDPDGSLRSLWGRVPSPYGAYLESILPDLGKNFCVWESA